MKVLCVLVCVGVCGSGCMTQGYSWGSCFGDFGVSNVCVTTNGYAIDQDRLAGIIENTYNEVVAKAGHQKRMDKFLETTVVYLSFEPDGNELLDYWSAEGLAYFAYDNTAEGPMGDHVVWVNVLIKYWPEFYDGCLELSPVAHEFLHVGMYVTLGLEKDKEDMHPKDWFGEGSVEERVHSDYADQMCPEEEP
jgi:hypothetical protein